MSAALGADVARDLHRALLGGCRDASIVVQFRVDEYLAVRICRNRGNVCPLDNAAADGDPCPVRFHRTPHLRVYVDQSLDVDFCASHVLARFDRSKVFARLFDPDLHCMRRIIIVLDDELRMSLAAHVTGTAGIPHDEDAAPIEAARRVGFNIHALDVLDREGAAVDGDRVRCTLPSRLFALFRQESMSAGACLDPKAMPCHVDAAFCVAVPVDRAEFVVLFRDDGVVRRFRHEFDVTVEGVVALAVVDALALPVRLGVGRAEVALGDLFVDGTFKLRRRRVRWIILCRRRWRVRRRILLFYMRLSVGFLVREIKLLRYGGSGQALGDHRLARKIPLPADIAVIVELSGERIQRLAHGCLIMECHTVAVRHHGDGGVLCGTSDVRVSIDLIGIFTRGIAPVVLCLRAIVDMLVDETHIAAEVIDNDIAFILLPDNTAIGIQAADAAVSQLCLAVFVHARAGLHMLPCAAVAEGKVAIALCQLPVVGWPCVHIGRKESLEHRVLRRQSDIGSSRARLDLHIAIDLHVTGCIHRNDVACTVHCCIDLCRAGRVDIERSIALRGNLSAADGERPRIDNHSLRRIDIDGAVDGETRSIVVALEENALILRCNLHRVVCRILDIEVCSPLITIGNQMNAVVLRTDRRLAERLHLECSAIHEDTRRLVSTALAGLCAHVAVTRLNGQRMAVHIDAAVFALAPHDAAKVITAVFVVRLDRVVTECGRKYGVTGKVIGRAAANPFRIPVLLFASGTVPVALDELAPLTDILLDAALTIRPERDIRELLRCR